MKVLVISSHTPSLFWFRMDMMKDFLLRGHEVIAIGNEDENKWLDSFKEVGIKYRKFNVEKNGMNPLKDLKTLKHLKKILKEEKPDKIFTYQAKPVIYGGLASRKYKIDTYPLIAGVGSVFLSKGLKASLVRFILKTEYKIALKKAKKVFFQNQDDVDLFIKLGIIKQDKVVIMHGSGVNLENFVPQELPSDVTFLSVSRLIKDKGVVEYLEAARLVKEQYPNTRFLLVGPFDTNPSSLKPEELQVYIDNNVVEYFGEQKDVRPYLKECSVFVLPSYREGTPKSVLEAMASYKAILTTDVPGCRETVVDGVNGYLVEAKDINALADKMIYFIEHKEIIPEMARLGRKMVEDKFDVKKVNLTVINTMEL